jgi:hypothetical protein
MSVFIFFTLLILAEELLSLHRGQGLEILWRDSLRCPSEEDYVKLVNNRLQYVQPRLGSLSQL